MATPPKLASRPSSQGSSSQDEAETQQYGRSPTALGAEAASAALRGDGITALPARSKPSSASNQRKHSTSGLVTRPGTAPPATPPPPPPRRRQRSYVPAVSSPLNPASPEGSVKSRDSSINFNEDVEKDRTNLPNTIPSQTTEATSAAPVSRGPIPGPPLPRRGRRKPSGLADLRRQQSPASLKPQAPMTLSDLGRDYSRYPSHKDRISNSGPLSAPRHYSRAVGTPRTALILVSLTPQNPFSDPPTNGEDPENGEKTFSPFLDDRMGAPSTADYGYGFPMYTDEKELDDDMHMPYPDDDVQFKPKFSDYLARRQLCSLFGMILILLGLICLFIVMPIISSSGTDIYGYPYDTPLNQMHHGDAIDPSSWAYVNSRKYSLLRNIRTGLIDPDTPDSAMTRKSIQGEDLQLVFSDEFNTPNRTFYPGDDPFWTGANLWYAGTEDMEWYDPDAISTYDGTLILQLDKFPNHGLDFRSGMLNSWNQICFKGGALEVSISLAGPGGVPGLWPGAWTMGNLGRPGYQSTTDGVWPYTYNSCDAGITPNQSSADGMSMLPGQKLSSCTCPGADHPTPGTGRGAPEIDVIEASADPNLRIGVVTQSYQVAPYDIWYRPNYDFLEIPNYNTTQMNAYCGGPFQQAISGTTILNNGWYDGNQYQKYAYEYAPGTGGDAQIGWFVGEDMSYMINGNAIGPNGNVQSRIISEEPMSIILNLGFSTSWTQIDWKDLKFPSMMHVDYVRWYQPSGAYSVTCDPPGYETTKYIADHPKAYNNPNLTTWDETGYGWPKHTLNSKC
ncbi:MAG: glycoside hydrolase family 16 [Lasallia pustulata]|uniref:Glycoside hydrolase family 16 n=1 Tax=Lasallia pustulata TaxID=136370 RepID=A0A5M8PME7_9LECA|nr:MAG: glycoside hydrolase family 16 [Lasallia pustulata]